MLPLRFLLYSYHRRQSEKEADITTNSIYIISVLIRNILVQQYWPFFFCLSIYIYIYNYIITLREIIKEKKREKLHINILLVSDFFFFQITNRLYEIEKTKRYTHTYTNNHTHIYLCKFPKENNQVQHVLLLLNVDLVVLLQIL